MSCSIGLLCRLTKYIFGGNLCVLYDAYHLLLCQKLTKVLTQLICYRKTDDMILMCGTFVYV